LTEPLEINEKNFPHT